MLMVKLDRIGRGVQLHRVRLGHLTVWFSYCTPVAYRIEGAGPVYRLNMWGPTTGRHLRGIREYEGEGPSLRGGHFLVRLGVAITRAVGDGDLVDGV